MIKRVKKRWNKRRVHRWRKNIGSRKRKKRSKRWWKRRRRRKSIG